MPLTRDRIIGHDNERLAFKFTMLNDDETVECQISDAAMDELRASRVQKASQDRRNFWRCVMRSRQSHPTCSTGAGRQRPCRSGYSPSISGNSRRWALTAVPGPLPRACGAARSAPYLRPLDRCPSKRQPVANNAGGTRHHEQARQDRSRTDRDGEGRVEGSRRLSRRHRHLRASATAIAGNSAPRPTTATIAKPGYPECVAMLVQIGDHLCKQYECKGEGAAAPQSIKRKICPPTRFFSS